MSGLNQCHESPFPACWTLLLRISLGETVLAAEPCQEENVGRVSDELVKIFPFDAVGEGVEVFDLCFETLPLTLVT